MGVEERLLSTMIGQSALRPLSSLRRVGVLDVLRADDANYLRTTRRASADLELSSISQDFDDMAAPLFIVCSDARPQPRQS
jgi:hypothetical protein